MPTNDTSTGKKDLSVGERVRLMQSPEARLKSDKFQDLKTVEERQEFLGTPVPEKRFFSPSAISASLGYDAPKVETSADPQVVEDDFLGFDDIGSSDEFGEFEDVGTVTDKTLGGVEEAITGTAERLILEPARDSIEGVMSLKDRLQERGKEFGDRLFELKEGTIEPGAAFGAAPSLFFGTLSDIVSEAVITGGKLILPEEGEEKVEEAFKTVVDDVAASNAAKDVSALWNSLPEEVRQNLKDAGTVGEFIADVFGAGLAKKPITEAIEFGAKKIDDFKTVKTKDAATKKAKDVPDSRKDILADRVATSLNRITKGEELDFVRMSNGMPSGKWLNDRGFTGTPYDNVEDLVNYWKTSKKQVDDALGIPTDRFRSTEIGEAIDILGGEIGKRSKDKGVFSSLSKKYKEGGLTLSEENEVKRLFERNVALEYKKDLTKTSKAKKEMTDLDRDIREGIVQRADDLGIKNIKELNKETQLARHLADTIAKFKKGQEVNNVLTLTDNISLGAATVNPSFLALYGLKKAASTDTAKSFFIRLLMKGRGVESLKKPDIDLIRKREVERRFTEEAQRLDRPALPVGKGEVSPDVVDVKPQRLPEKSEQLERLESIR